MIVMQQLLSCVPSHNNELYALGNSSEPAEYHGVSDFLCLQAQQSIIRKGRYLNVLALPTTAITT